MIWATMAHRAAVPASAWCLAALLLLHAGVRAQLSAPIAHDSNVHHLNKFMMRRPEHDTKSIEEEE
jgi:hypothetical protein